MSIVLAMTGESCYDSSLHTSFSRRSSISHDGSPSLAGEIQWLWKKGATLSIKGKNKHPFTVGGRLFLVADKVLTKY